MIEEKARENPCSDGTGNRRAASDRRHQERFPLLQNWPAGLRRHQSRHPAFNRVLDAINLDFQPLIKSSTRGHGVDV